jgi:ABC-type nitrate/sulfonate/bicarbonate transport system ATPase subunit/ABC-type nitrate/sulfonate/bicarbonate transport system permease component
LGVTIGFVTGRLPVVRRILEPGISLLKAAPFITLIPLSMRIFGLSELGKVFLIAWIAATVSWLIVHQAVLKTPDELYWLWRCSGEGRFKWVTLVLIPCHFENLRSALRASASLAIIVVAAVEMGGVYERSSQFWWSEGLGYRVFRAMDVGRDDQMLGCITIFAVLGLCVDWLVVNLATFAAVGARCCMIAKARRGLLRVRKVSLNRNRHRSTVSNLAIGVEYTGYGERTVFQGFHCEILGRETLTVIGPSGCGKTTLLKAIASLSAPGFAYLAKVEKKPSGEGLRPSEIAIVFQDGSVFEHLTVWDNVTFGRNGRSTEGRRWAFEVLQQCGIDEIGDRLAGNLSGGQRQRLAFALALSNRPELLLLDEPFGALDAITRRKLQEFYCGHIQGRIPCVFVTHSLDEAITVGNRVRVGLGADGEMVVEKSGRSIAEWEESEDYLNDRNRLIHRLRLITS